MKFFSIAGPVKPEKHYCLPLKTRLDEEELRLLIMQEKYFILHAPRQTGKTSTMSNFAKTLNAEGTYTALYVNIEGARAARSDYIKGMATILEQFFRRIKSQLPEEHHIIDYLAQLLQRGKFTGSSLNSMLNEWAQNSAKPIVLFIDEIDSAVGDTLLSVLSQLRSGYDQRPTGFPQSLCLIGVRDVRDYRIWSDEKQEMVLGGSAFNIKSESLRMADFTEDEVRALYLQHTTETGQKFDDDAIAYAFELTQGQPWLVNALAYQACFRDVRDRTQPITKDVIETAKEILIERRDINLEALKEPRVRAIIDARIAGKFVVGPFLTQANIQYVRDLGLIKMDGLKISNPIYQEAIARELVQAALAKETVGNKTITVWGM